MEGLALIVGLLMVGASFATGLCEICTVAVFLEVDPSSDFMTSRWFGGLMGESTESFSSSLGTAMVWVSPDLA